MALPYLSTATLPYGSRVITVSSVGYIAENFEVQESTNEINRQTEIGAPNGFILIREPKTGTATLQLASTSTTYVSSGDSFNATSRGTSITWVVTQASDPEAARDMKKQNISFRELV